MGTTSEWHSYVGNVIAKEQKHVTNMKNLVGVF
jgi:hypothetical protein